MIRRALSAVRSAATAVVAPFVPEPGTTEGAVMLGMALLAAGFVIADLVPLALLVPGALLVAIGVIPVLRRPS